jgi:type II secretory pathway pseudopilin PulG
MIKYKKNGYTLVELLAVIFILVAVGTIISSILTSVLRSSNKSTNTEVVRTNGNNAIAQMSRMITYAQKLEGVSVDGISYSDCTVSSVGATTPTPTPVIYGYLRIKSFDGGVTTFSCANSQVASQSASGTSYLVDPSLNASCYFNCAQESAAAPVKIDIFLDLKATSSAVFAESQAVINFETSVVLRNNGNR